MKRYGTEFRGEDLYLETDDGWIEVGSIEDIHDLVGGETYTLEYDERQRTVGWLDTDSDGTITFEVRETLADMSYDEEFVGNVVSVEEGATDEEGYPLRTSVFADLMTTIWDSKGNL